MDQDNLSGLLANRVGSQRQATTEKQPSVQTHRCTPKPRGRVRQNTRHGVRELIAKAKTRARFRIDEERKGGGCEGKHVEMTLLLALSFNIHLRAGWRPAFAVQSTIWLTGPELNMNTWGTNHLQSMR